jgi:large subunit ribosomal protein L15
MELFELKPQEGARRRNKRVGRGRGSGHGKTSTRGHNGQGQRSGESKRFGFEGGQTPLFRRLPKIHNFNEVPTRDWVEVNVGLLNVLPANCEVTAETLVEHKILRKHSDSLRILGNGELKVALKVTAHHVTEGAKKKIEAAGGTVTVVEVKVVDGKRAKRLRQAEERHAQAEARRLAPKPESKKDEAEEEKPKKKSGSEKPAQAPSAKPKGEKPAAKSDKGKQKK